MAVCLALPATGEPSPAPTPWHITALARRVPLTVTSDLYRQRDRLLIHAMPALANEGGGTSFALRVVEVPGGRLLPAVFRQARLLVRLPGLLRPGKPRRLLVYYGPKVHILPVAPGPPWPADRPLPGRNLVADSSFEAMASDARRGWHTLTGTWRVGVRLGPRRKPARLGNYAWFFDARVPGDGLCYRLIESAPMVVVPGTRLLFGVWARTLRPGGTTGVYLRFFDGQGRFLGRGQGDVMATSSVIASDDWKRLRAVAQVPVGAASARLQLGRCWGGGALAFDDAFAMRIGQARPVTVSESPAQVRP